MFNKIKTRYIWIFALVLFLFAVGFILLAIYTPSGISNKLFIVLMTIDLILFTFTIQWGIQRSIRYKPKPIKYETKLYESNKDFDEALKNNKFELRNRSYGRSYIKIEGKNAYKVVLINEPDNYFIADNNDSNSGLAKKLDRCDTFTAVEIFLNSNDEIKAKIADFTLQGERVYYTALERTNDGYLCHNYIMPNENHKINLEHLYEYLGLVEKTNTNEEEN